MSQPSEHIASARYSIKEIFNVIETFLKEETELTYLRLSQELGISSTLAQRLLGSYADENPVGCSLLVGIRESSFKIHYKEVHETELEELLNSTAPENIESICVLSIWRQASEPAALWRSETQYALCRLRDPKTNQPIWIPQYVHYPWSLSTQSLLRPNSPIKSKESGVCSQSAPPTFPHASVQTSPPVQSSPSNAVLISSRKLPSSQASDSVKKRKLRATSVENGKQSKWFSSRPTSNSVKQSSNVEASVKLQPSLACIEVASSETVKLTNSPPPFLGPAVEQASSGTSPRSSLSNSTGDDPMVPVCSMSRPTDDGEDENLCNWNQQRRKKRRLAPDSDDDDGLGQGIGTSRFGHNEQPASAAKTVMSCGSAENHSEQSRRNEGQSKPSKSLLLFADRENDDGLSLEASSPHMYTIKEKVKVERVSRQGKYTVSETVSEVKTVEHTKSVIPPNTIDERHFPRAPVKDSKRQQSMSWFLKKQKAQEKT